MSEFPEELIREILLRLPVKSLLRFRSVCKSWLSLISDPLFAKTHFELASNPTDRLLHLTASQTRSIDVNASFYDHSAVATLNFPLAAPFHYIGIRGSCRGFLLLDDEENLFVWNPSTGSCKNLSYPPISPHYFRIKHGLGYDSSTDDYVVVLAYIQAYPFDLGTHFEIFSLKNNSWENFGGTHLIHGSFFDARNSGIFLNDAIHWLDYGPDEQVNLIAFDLAKKNVRQLPLPDFEFEHVLEVFDLGLLGGCLSLFIVERYKTETWVMKEYGLESSWERSVFVPVGETPTEFFLPKCFTKGNEIFGIYDDEGLMKCNHQGVLLEHLTCGHDKYDYMAIMYTESLLSLPGGIGGGEEMQQ